MSVNLINHPLLQPEYINKVLDEAMSENQSLGSLNWQPPIDDPSKLPMFADEGDVYYCTSTDESYVMVGGEWIKFSGVIDGVENPLDKVIRTMEENGYG